MPLNFLLIGQTERAEANPLAEWLSASLQPVEQQHFTDLTTALSEIKHTNSIPDLIVIVQGWPDEFSPSEIASLLTFAPLARVVVAYGAWCESDGRNRHLWPLAVRAPLRSAAARIEREWRLLHEERGFDPLPLSASREEIFAADHSSLVAAVSPHHVLVVSPDPAYRQYLVEFLAFAGHSVYPADAPPSGFVPTAILFDADPWNSRQVNELRSLRQRNPCASSIVLMSLPHADDEATLLAIGASCVLPKLGDQSHILIELERVATTPAFQPA